MKKTMQPYQLYYAECTKCENCIPKLDRNMCIVKHIDCSVRSNVAPCTHYQEAEEVEELHTYEVTMTATCTVTVEAHNEDEAAEKAEWDDFNYDVLEMVDVQEVKE